MKGTSDVKFYLVMEKGLVSERMIPVETRVTIGRGPGNTIQVADPGVSKQHAVVYLEEGKAVVEDLGSLNGTFINGKKVGKGALAAGDILRVGRVSLRFYEEKESTSEGNRLGETQYIDEADFKEPSPPSEELHSIVAVLSRAAIFSRLDRETLEELGQSAEIAGFEPGEIVIGQGDRDRSVYVIVKGKVRVFTHDQKGDEVLLSFLAEGDFFGEISLLTGAHRTATVQAEERTLLCRLGYGVMQELIQRHPAVKDLLEQYHRQRLRELLKALRESEDRYSTLFNSASDAIFICDFTGRFLEVNEAACERLGFTQEELLQMRCEDIEAPEYAGLLSRRLDELREHGHIVFETEHLTKEGEKVPVEVSARIIEHAGTPAVLTIARDITERKAAEKEKEKLEEQLVHSQKMEAIGRLAGGIAHDFNNLLTTILGHADLVLTSAEGSEPLLEDVQAIKKAGERAASLVRQLLAFSRKQVLQPAVLDLNSVVIDMEKMLRRLIGEDIELETVLKPGLHQVKVDPGQIEQIIMNLAVNARDAMPQGGKLTVETANVELSEDYTRRRPMMRPGPYVMLVLSDTGIGMEAETLSHVFEPFFTTKELGKGTGLGLATVYGIVKQSGGYIWVYSEPGEGTTFKIYLPSVQEGEEAVRKPHESSGKGGDETVLVVEDDDMLRNMARNILKRYGYRVLEAQDAETALEASRGHEGPIHLLLTDVVMPGISGRELAERLQSERPAARVLFMSGYTDEAVVHHGVLESGISFVQKPFSPDVLARKVREVLDTLST